jgi:hypothetical protein
MLIEPGLLLHSGPVRFRAKHDGAAVGGLTGRVGARAPHYRIRADPVPLQRPRRFQVGHVFQRVWA